jgi:serine/threonine-protein kinase HipA
VVALVDTAVVRLWGQTVGAVAWDRNRRVGTFEYEPTFLRSGLEISPLRMPLSHGRRRHRFVRLPEQTFHGLPGLLADSLPDRFGNQIIDAWLARQGRAPHDFSPVERLCYMGARGMGALEYSPSLLKNMQRSVPVELARLVTLAADVIENRQDLRANLQAPTEALLDIMRVGTSAGGARPKAVIAIHPDTGEVRSGQVLAPEGFEYWLIKFDGVSCASLGDPAGFGRIELAYHTMAVTAGLHMMPCQLLEEGGRAHFMTRRFDRGPTGQKKHLQSLCALGHHDFNDPGATSYEQAFGVARQLAVPQTDIDDLYRRMVFNVLARNQDDHTKNIAFLMDRSGTWRLSPAYDVCYSYNPAGRWTSTHQMSIAGKRDNFTLNDLIQTGEQHDVLRPERSIKRVADAVAQWSDHAKRAGVTTDQLASIARTHRTL